MSSSPGESPWTIEEGEREITGWAGKEIVEEGERETVAVSREGPVAE
jgi:hypothetical protein